MSAGTRAQMAAATVASHKKQPSTSSKASATPIIIQKEESPKQTLESTQPPQQLDVSSTTLHPASTPSVTNNLPHKVSQEYHTLQEKAEEPEKQTFDVKDSSDGRENSIIDSAGTSITDSDNLDLLSESEQLAIQEAEQHDYENAVSVEPPVDVMSNMYQRSPQLAADDPNSDLLGPIRKELEGRKCLVLDLDETLVHSSFRYIRRADFVIPVQIDNQYHNVYVIKRPGVDEFMRRVGELYEVVVFTASVSKYGDPLLDQLDIHNVVHHRLFRESCYSFQGNFVKNLAVLGRPLQDVIIIDNSPTSYIFHPQHAIPVSSWFSDAHDNELLDMIPFLEDLATTTVPDVSMVLDVNLD